MYGAHNCLDQLFDCNAHTPSTSTTPGTGDNICSAADNFCFAQVEEPFDVTFNRDEYDIRYLTPSPFPYSFYVDYLNTATVKTTNDTIKETIVSKKQTTIKAALGIAPKTDTPKAAKPVREKKLKLRETMYFHELTPAKAAEHGYLLWEFRPMDNSFMEEWGTFDKVPRYKWEKPTIMDSDVAVSVEYARAVLDGEIEHRWMKKGGTKA